MTAGRGIRHSEFNPSSTEPVHLYQIWLLPREAGLPPSYSQKTFAAEQRNGAWQLVASPDGAAGSLRIEQDAGIHLATLVPNREQTFDLAAGRFAWLQVLRGALDLNTTKLQAGDAAAVSDELRITLKAAEPAEVMLFDLA
jgi:redox-sensitive bicupin YhaK (pirin superfamily)